MAKGKMLITGARGILGGDLASFFSSSYRLFPVSSRDFDIRDEGRVLAYLDSVKPDIVLHSAAIADVDRCESDRETARAVNIRGTENVAGACRKTGARMIYYSTDYVFGGEKTSFYVESDTPDPVNYYGYTKLEGERRTASLLDDYAIVRVAWIYSESDRSFVNRLIRSGRSQMEGRMSGRKYEPLKVVTDQVGCPTWAVEIARQTDIIIDNKLTGVVHCTSGGGASRYEFARFLFESLSMDVDLQPCRMSEMPRPAPRPKFTALENRRLGDLGLNVMKDNREALLEFLKKTGKK
jgi:dTDP-4-dehydrorhamnose reductase